MTDDFTDLFVFGMKPASDSGVFKSFPLKKSHLFFLFIQHKAAKRKTALLKLAYLMLTCSSHCNSFSLPWNVV